MFSTSGAQFSESGLDDSEETDLDQYSFSAMTKWFFASERQREIYYTTNHVFKYGLSYTCCSFRRSSHHRSNENTIERTLKHKSHSTLCGGRNIIESKHERSSHLNVESTLRCVASFYYPDDGRSSETTVGIKRWPNKGELTTDKSNQIHHYQMTFSSQFYVTCKSICRFSLLDEKSFSQEDKV